MRSDFTEDPKPVTWPLSAEQSPSFWRGGFVSNQTRLSMSAVTATAVTAVSSGMSATIATTVSVSATRISSTAGVAATAGVSLAAVASASTGVIAGIPVITAPVSAAVVIGRYVPVPIAVRRVIAR